MNYWYGKNGTAECERIKRASQELGIQVHSLIEWQFKNPDTRLSSETNSHRMVNNFWNKFVEPYEVKPKEMEMTLKDNKLKFQGTFDALISTNKGHFIADWKTSNTLDKISVPLQLSAYAYLLKTTGYGEIHDGLVVRIDKESDKVEVKTYDKLESYWKVFRKALALAKFIKFGIEI